VLEHPDAAVGSQPEEGRLPQVEDAGLADLMLEPERGQAQDDHVDHEREEERAAV